MIAFAKVCYFLFLTKLFTLFFIIYFFF